MNPQIKAGVFGGSFNPIHIGHLAIANYLCEYGEVDEVWFIVSPHNPLKKEKELWDDDFRLELVRTAIGDYPKFSACDIEFHLPKPSYTITTLDALKKQHPERDFTLIIGSDNWEIFNKWHKPQEIIDRYHLLIYPRLGYHIDTGKLPAHVKLVNAPTIEISSTAIREAIRMGKDIRYFLYPTVYQRIIDRLNNG